MSGAISLGSRATNQTPWDLIEGSGQDLAQAVTTLVDHLADDDAVRICDDRILEDLYTGYWVGSEDLSFAVAGYASMGGDPVKLNFARNAVDFVHTKVCSDTPGVVASAVGGDYALDRRADDLSKTIDEAMSAADADGVLMSAGLAALKTGTAVVKASVTKDKRPHLEQVPAEWVFVDPTEARCGSIRTLYERRPVPRRYVRDTWGDDDPDLEAAIDAAGAAADPLLLDVQSHRGHEHDLIDLYEAFALPADDDHPGRHVVCCHNVVLLDEEWTVPRFPHAFLRASDPAPGRGFWGQGLLEQLEAPQAEIDFLLGQVSEQIRLSQLKYFVKADSQMSDDQLRASFNGTIIKYTTTIPQAVTPSTMSKDAFNHIQWLVQQLYAQVGMSEQAATSQRPAGINSGRAILFFHDFQTKRYVDLVKRYGRFTIDVVERLLDALDKSPDDPTLSIRLEEVSAVPSSYAGRMQRIEQLIAQGQVPEGYWTQYLSDPDAWSAEHRAKSQADHIDWLLQQLESPEADMPPLSDKLDFDLVLEVLTGETLTLIRRKADQDIIDRVEDFFDQVVARRKELQQLAAQQQTDAAVQQVPAAAPQAPALPMGGLGATDPNAS